MEVLRKGVCTGWLAAVVAAILRPDTRVSRAEGGTAPAPQVLGVCSLGVIRIVLFAWLGKTVWSPLHCPLPSGLFTGKCLPYLNFKISIGKSGKHYCFHLLLVNPCISQICKV